MGKKDIWDTNKKEEKRQSICQACILKPNPNVLKKKWKKKKEKRKKKNKIGDG